MTKVHTGKFNKYARGDPT